MPLSACGPHRRHPSQRITAMGPAYYADSAGDGCSADSGGWCWWRATGRATSTTAGPSTPWGPSWRGTARWLSGRIDRYGECHLVSARDVAGDGPQLLGTAV